MIRFAVVLAVGLASTGAHAQYKCTGSDGKVTFQQAPCTGGTSVRAASNGADAPSIGGKALCEIYARKTQVFKDPESIRLNLVSYAGARTVTIGEQVIVSRAYTLLINAKNSYGAYEGEKLYTCFLSEDEQRFLRFVRGTDPN